MRADKVYSKSTTRTTTTRVDIPEPDTLEVGMPDIVNLQLQERALIEKTLEDELNDIRDKQDHGKTIDQEFPRGEEL